ncbi:N-acetylglucosamine-6-phosphate deacetylase [Cytobacillus sp. Hz8]|uniref:N-acetylglucosamine-6-phosphate deacetylase n=1 Tax=Cytobacillus sp. Hz8 TaxID=3347168 RepID=UPI0035DB8F18
MNKDIILKGMEIYTDQKVIADGYIKIQNEKISEVGELKNLKATKSFEVIEISSSFKAVPGFIDLHIHGVAGADTMDATTDALKTMATALPKEGTTSFLATTITQNKDTINHALENAGEYITEQQTPGRSEILGIHLEGPFVNPKMAGAQPKEYIIDPDIELLKNWQSLSKDNIRLVTMAPEQPGALEMIHYLKRNEIVASIGHSNATYAEVLTAIEAGATHITHLFNQMRGLHHREPGVVGAAFLRDELKVEMIVDGIHVQPEVVKIAYNQKQKDGLILITDAMRAKCLENGTYDLGGQEVTVKEGKAVLKDGTLAGSILKLGQAFKNIIQFAGCTLEDAIKMASVNPAKQINVFDRKGSISTGKDADIVILDENLDVMMTFCKGQLAFENGGDQK